MGSFGPCVPTLSRMTMVLKAHFGLKPDDGAGLRDLLGVDDVPAAVASIGPVTSATARAAGLEVTVEAVEARRSEYPRGLGGSGSTNVPGPCGGRVWPAHIDEP